MNLVNSFFETSFWSFYCFVTNGGFSGCSEMVECFQQISDDQACRVVVISGAGTMFTAGERPSVCRRAFNRNMFM